MRTVIKSPLNLKKNPQKSNKKLLKDTATVSRYSQEVSHIIAVDFLNTFSAAFFILFQILQSQEDEEESDVDDYFTDMEESVNMTNNPQNSLMSLLRK